MSNDQSPPVRKIIPYKKGGPRQSPFAGKAFQFSGTALDIAIQQREQEELEEKSESTASEGLVVETPQQAPPTPKAQSFQEIGATTDEPSPVLADTNQELTRQVPAITKKSGSFQSRTGPKIRSAPNRSKNNISTQLPISPKLQAFISQWKPFLTDTQIGICVYVYNNSTEVGKEFCFTSTAKLMAEVSKTERQIKTVLNQLVEWNFLIKGETIINVPREKRGTHYKLNLDKL